MFERRKVNVFAHLRFLFDRKQSSSGGISVHCETSLTICPLVHRLRKEKKQDLSMRDL